MNLKFRNASFILAVLLSFSTIHLFIYTQNIGLKYELNKLKIKLNDIRSKTRLLGSQVSQREDLAYIDRYAQEKLSMLYPELVTYISTRRTGEVQIPRQNAAEGTSREAIP